MASGVHAPRPGHGSRDQTAGAATTTYQLELASAGLIVLLAALLPTYLRRRPLSLPMIVVAAAVIAFMAVPGLDAPDPREHLTIAEHATELCVLISLLGAGLSIDRRPGWTAWAPTWRLLSIGMLVTIGATALLGWSLGLAPAAALLLGAAIAPTDPVLAADVQVGEPAVEGAPTDTEDEVRLALTSEAGLNDGLAFPFVFASVAIATHGTAPGEWFVDWLIFDLVIRLFVGLLVGWVAGRVLARLIFSPPAPLTPLADTNEGFVAVGAILITYGIAELSHGYGFLAVFVAAITLRDRQRDHGYHRTLHQFTGQIEQLLSIALLVLLGAAVAGGVLAALSVRSVIVALAVVFVVRPLSGRLALMGTSATPAERRAIAFFGIRGIGSLYYLAYATGHATFGDADELWATATFTVLLSIFVHGVTATPVMRALDRRRARRRRPVIAAD